MSKDKLDIVIEKLNKIIELLEGDNKNPKLLLEYLKKKEKQEAIKRHIIDTTPRINDPVLPTISSIPNIPLDPNYVFIPNSYPIEYHIDPSKITCTSTTSSFDDYYNINEN